ncbi:hypothetical protein [Paenibacillus aquistagni]|nr:hypothetical protein [Paenibacillus aquistagni]NMM51057.1 hypothetical protein [Paenibacillus aquistagni]
MNPVNIVVKGRRAMGAFAVYAFFILILAMIIYGAVRRAINDSRLTELTEKKIELLEEIKSLLENQQAR